MIAVDFYTLAVFSYPLNPPGNLLATFAVHFIKIFTFIKPILVLQSSCFSSPA